MNNTPKVIRSAYVLTPYYRDIIEVTSNPFWYEKQSQNYIPYNFYVITTRLRPNVPSTYYIDYASYKLNGKMQFAVQFMDGINVVQLTNDDANKYQKLVDDIIVTYPDHCTLFYKDQIFISTSQYIPLPNQWVNSILPYCYNHLLDQQYDPLYMNDQVLINISPTRSYYDINIDDHTTTNYYYEYDKVFFNLQELFINTLYDIYKQGAIVLNPSLDKTFIEKWSLIPLYNNTNQANETQIYIATWRDERFAPNITEFLSDRLHDIKYIPISLNNHSINNNLIEISAKQSVSMHLIANQLKQYPNNNYYFLNNSLYIDADNIELISHITNIVNNNIYKTNNDITLEITNVPVVKDINNNPNVVIYKNINNINNPLVISTIR